MLKIKGESEKLCVFTLEIKSSMGWSFVSYNGGVVFEKVIMVKVTSASCIFPPKRDLG